jgi:hypothetical protein
MSEYLSFNTAGQWELHKSTNPRTGDDNPPKDMDKPGNKPFQVYHGNAMVGSLHADHDTRGELHDFGGGIRPKADRVNWKNAGKPAHPTDSMYSERNPGVGE